MAVLKMGEMNIRQETEADHPFVWQVTDVSAQSFPAQSYRFRFETDFPRKEYFCPGSHSNLHSYLCLLANCFP